MKYEITYIIRPDLDDASKTALVDRFDKILTDNGADLIWFKEIGRSSFRIRNRWKYNEGQYHVINLTTDNDTALNEFDRLSKINDDILRHMIVKRED